MAMKMWSLKRRDRIDMLAMSSDIFAGFDNKKTLAKHYQRDRSDEAFEELYNQAKTRAAISRTKFAKDGLQRAVAKCLEAGLSKEEIIQLVSSEG